MIRTTQPRTETPDERRDALSERLLRAAQGVFEAASVYLGDNLGFYNVLREDGALTSGELAARTGTHPRYVREWLEQQAVVGILEVDDPRIPEDQRRFALPAGHDEVLADRDSLDYMAPLAQLIFGALSPLPRVVEAYRRGGGVPYADYGTDLIEGQARMNRAAFLQLLGGEWLPSIPDVHERLGRGEARVADFGCGAGHSSIGIAKHYPKARIDGFDLDQASIEMARANARAEDLEDRVSFEVRDVADPALEGRYDLVTALECVHDLGDPVGALRTMRRLLNDEGTVLVVDERVGSHFLAEDGDLDGLMYGWSLFHCLPSGMADSPSVGTGTVMRCGTLERYAREAGFASVEVLPIENLFFRFYRLRVR